MRQLLVLVLPSLFMALTFTVMAEAGLVTSDPEGLHKVNAVEMWSMSFGKAVK